MQCVQCLGIYSCEQRPRCGHSVNCGTCAQTIAGDMIVNNNFDMTALFTSNIVKLQVQA